MNQANYGLLSSLGDFIQVRIFFISPALLFLLSTSAESQNGEIKGFKCKRWHFSQGGAPTLQIKESRGGQIVPSNDQIKGNYKF